MRSPECRKNKPGATRNGDSELEVTNAISVPMSSGRQIMRSPQHSLAPLAFTAIKPRSSRQWMQQARASQQNGKPI